jgi:hypothetical protein
MPDVNGRLDGIEDALTGVSRQVGEQFTEVKQRLDKMAGEMQRVRVLGEENSTQIRLVAEVQTHHGHLLEQLVKEIEPLKVLPDLFKQVAQDHERRITALEKGSGSRP